MDRHAVCERERRRRVPQHVQCPGRQPSCFAVAQESLRKPLRVDRSAQRVGEHEVTVEVRVACEVEFDELDVPVPLERSNRVRVERHSASGTS